MMEGEVLGIAAALGSAASWAVGAILFKRLGESIQPLAMTFAKGVASVVLLGFVIALSGVDGVSQRDLLILAASGLVGIAVGDTLFFAALRDLSPSTLIVLLMMSQVLTAILALVLLGERLPMMAWAGIGAIILGVGVVLWTGSVGEKSPSRRRGITLGLLSVVCMAASTIMAKEGLDSSSALEATFVRMGAGMAGVTIYGFFTAQLGHWMGEFRNFQLARSFLVAVCVVTFGGFWLSLLAIKHLEVAIANTLISTEPIFVLPLAALFLNERITIRAVAGTVLATAGVVIVCLA